MKNAIACPKCGGRIEPSPGAARLPKQCPFCSAALRRKPKSAPAKSALNPESAAPSKNAEQQWRPKKSVAVKESGSRWTWGLAALVLLIVAGVVGLVVIPPLLPKDSREVVILNYLKAARDGDLQEARRWGVLEELPKTSSNSRGRWVEEKETVSEGDFAGVADFHRAIQEKYRRQGDVYIIKDQTGQLAKLINKREAIKKKAEEAVEQSAEPSAKPRSEADRLFDMAEDLAKNYESVVDMVIGGPESDSIAVTYEQLLEQEGADLTAAQRELLDSYRNDKAKWDRLLAGSTLENLSERGPFLLQRSTWEMQVWLPNQSSGEPPVTVHFELLRFQVGLADSGWKVWDYQVQRPLADANQASVEP